MINLPNSLEEELRAVQTTKAYWKKQYEKEEDSLKKAKILSRLYALTDEESRILTEINRGDDDGIANG